MNFSPVLTTTPAIIMSLMAAFMWGTWFISLKYLKNYPLDGFYVTLFSTSLLLVWSVGFILDGKYLIGNISSVLASDSLRVWLTLLCGIIYVVGMRISLYVYSVIGLSLSQPIQSSVNVLVGTAVAAYVGGVPSGLTLPRIVLSVIFLLIAVFASLMAGRWNSESNATVQSGPKGRMNYSTKDLWRSLGLLFFCSLFVPSYTFGLSYGLRSTTHPQGLAVMPFMALLASGAFIGCLLTSGIILTTKKQWSVVLHTPLKLAKFGVFAGVFHYGGNIIHTFSTAFLSSAVSWPLGVTSGLWTQMWGLIYGEFKGAPKKAYVALCIGIVFYLLGAYFIAFH
jgi:hypothetical protein